MIHTKEYDAKIVKLAVMLEAVLEDNPIDIAISALIDTLCRGIETLVPESRRMLIRLECIQFLLEDATTDEQVKLS